MSGIDKQMIDERKRRKNAPTTEEGGVLVSQCERPSECCCSERRFRRRKTALRHPPSTLHSSLTSPHFAALFLTLSPPLFSFLALSLSVSTQLPLTLRQSMVSSHEENKAPLPHLTEGRDSHMSQEHSLTVYPLFTSIPGILHKQCKRFSKAGSKSFQPDIPAHEHE